MTAELEILEPEPVELPAAGFHQVDFETYKRWPALNVSTLKPFEVDPSQCVYERENPKKATDAMLKGSAGDILALEGAKEFERIFAVLPKDVIRNAAHQKYKDFLAKADGREVIRKVDFEYSWAVAQAFREHPEVAKLLPGAQAQMSMVWQCPVTGVWCKGRPDLYSMALGRPIFLDMKVTEFWRKHDFSRQLANMRWYWQAYWYCWGASVIMEYDHSDFRFGCVKPKPVHLVQVHKLPLSDLEFARNELEPLVVQYAECLAADKWEPGYQELTTTGLPAWKYRKGEG